MQRKATAGSMRPSNCAMSALISLSVSSNIQPSSRKLTTMRKFQPLMQLRLENLTPQQLHFQLDIALTAATCVSPGAQSCLARRQQLISVAVVCGMAHCLQVPSGPLGDWYDRLRKTQKR